MSFPVTRFLLHQLAESLFETLGIVVRLGVRYRHSWTISSRASNALCWSKCEPNRAIRSDWNKTRPSARRCRLSASKRLHGLGKHAPLIDTKGQPLSWS